MPGPGVGYRANEEELLGFLALQTVVACAAQAAGGGGPRSRDSGAACALTRRGRAGKRGWLRVGFAHASSCPRLCQDVGPKHASQAVRAKCHLLQLLVEATVAPLAPKPEDEEDVILVGEGTIPELVLVQD